MEQILNTDPIKRIFEQQQTRSQQPRIIKAEATPIKTRVPPTRAELAIMLFILSGLCGAVLGLFLYFLH